MDAGLGYLDFKKIAHFEVRAQKNGDVEIKYPESAVNRQIAATRELERLKNEDIFQFYRQRYDHQKQRTKEIKSKENKEAKASLRKFTQNDYEPLELTLRLGSLKLPQELVCSIVKHLAESFEPDGIRGVAITLKDLVNASLSCPDFFVAIKYGLKLFASILPPFPELTGIVLDTFVNDPTDARIKDHHLRSISYALRLKVSGTKACMSRQFDHCL